MRKKRLRGGEREQRSTAVRERTARVRNRLTASVAVTALAVLGGSALGVVDAARELGQDRKLVARAEDTGPALALAHSLADERDAMTQFAAAGRDGAAAAGVSKDQRALVDRQIEEYVPSAPASVRRLLDGLPATREQALSGGDALTVHTAYTTTVQALHRAGDAAGTGGPAALLPLGRAVEEASATRALLLAALTAKPAQTGDAQTARAGRQTFAAAARRTAQREQDAVADFRRLAGADARDTYDRTVGGAEVTVAEGHLTRLLRDSAPEGPADPVRTALTVRLDRMRGVESVLVAGELGRLQRLRAGALTDLELRAAAAALCLLTALVAGVRAGRSVTRPLDVLRLGARRVCADPAAERPIAFKGRDDEFAETVRSVNVLRETAHRMQERIAVLEGERTRLVASRRTLAEEREALRAQHQELTDQLSEQPAERPADPARERAHGLHVGLSLRTLRLVERQLAVIEGMEAHETDPERLETLFTLDHLATRMRRNSENVLALAGAETGTGRTAPVPLLDVLRAAAGEIERYQRVRIQSLPPHARLAGYASEDISHLMAELLENATEFSPSEAHVQLSGWLLETGEVVLSVQDEGIGITPGRLAGLNALLADPDPEPPAPAAAGRAGHPEPRGERGDGEQGQGLGLHVVARLAGRHGVHVQLREQMTGGTAAVVVLPLPVLAESSPTVTGLADAPPAPGTAASPRVHLPGSLADANSHALPGRPQRAVPGQGSGQGAGRLTGPAAGLIAGHPAPVPLPAPVHPADPPALPPGSPIRVTGLPVAPAVATGRHARLPAPADPSVGNGLPKRTPKAVPQQPAPPPARGSVDAEALRRKLSGFQRGATAGRRDAEAEWAGRTTDRNAAGSPAQGGTVEEARG
ncbi:sensor histidine kinase [Streptomyces albireticuli]|uniref:sensor histidine kinase n=1 Tax=Streptomyces albireticuli TaxID=1940 RepID=UPI001E63B22D|nr:nitrate- and nitrite sensing domain-containing protein [Streptomyces albireticuli]